MRRIANEILVRGRSSEHPEDDPSNREADTEQCKSLHANRSRLNPVLPTAIRSLCGLLFAPSGYRKNDNASPPSLVNQRCPRTAYFLLFMTLP